MPAAVMTIHWHETKTIMKLILPTWASLFCLFMAASPAMAAFQAYRLNDTSDATEAIKLDGKLDDAVWQKAALHDTFYQTQPFDKVKAKVRTEVKVAYDKAYLYVGVKSYDPNAELIREPFARRDKISADQDFLGLFIDPSGAHKSAQVIYLNARGAITDGVNSDTNGDDFSPDFDFDVATSRFDGGWSAEVRIPFSSLAYNADQTTPWSLLVMRNMTREQRYRMYSGQVTRATNCNLCFSDPIEGLHHLPSGLSWGATPQLVMRRNREDTAGRPSQTKNSTDLSLDVKLRPNSATTIDATLNPDFSQIELDAPQLSGNTRFGLFVQEKRPFFLEGADIFRTPMNAISTRTISNPDWGLRYTRRDADKDLTILTNRDAGGGLVQLPNAYGTDYALQNFTSQATDARANFRLGALTVGGILTDRSISGTGAYNRVIGPDFGWQVSENERVRGQLLSSATTAQPDGKGNLINGAMTTGYAAYLDWYRSNDQWAVYAVLNDISKDFRSDNGFFSQVGYRSIASDVSKKQGKTGIWNEFNFTLHVERKLDHEGNVIGSDYSPGVWMAGPYDSEMAFSIAPSNSSRVERNGALFHTALVRASFNIRPSQIFARLTGEMSYGDTIDVASSRLGKGGAVTLSARIRPFDRFELEPNYATSWVYGISGPEAGQRLYTEQALQVNGIVHFSRKDTLRAILQHAHTSRNVALYSMPVAASSKRNIGSLVFTHTAGLGTAAFIGITMSNTDTPGYALKRRQSEIFTKLSWQI